MIKWASIDSFSLSLVNRCEWLFTTQLGHWMTNRYHSPLYRYDLPSINKKGPAYPHEQRRASCYNQRNIPSSILPSALFHLHTLSFTLVVCTLSNWHDLSFSDDHSSERKREKNEETKGIKRVVVIASSYKGGMGRMRWLLFRVQSTHFEIIEKERNSDQSEDSWKERGNVRWRNEEREECSLIIDPSHAIHNKCWSAGFNQTNESTHPMQSSKSSSGSQQIPGMQREFNACDLQLAGRGKKCSGMERWKDEMDGWHSGGTNPLWNSIWLSRCRLLTRFYLISSWRISIQLTHIRYI